MNDIITHEGNPGPLVEDRDGELFTNSLALAEGVGNPHKSVLQLIRQNVDDLEDFGGVAFEMRPFETPGGTQTREIAYLNEQQATLLLTYMRNNDVVKAFKKALVKAFFELRERVAVPQINVRDPGQLTKIAIQLIEVNRDLEAKVEQMTETVQAYDRIATAEGSLCVTDAAKALQVRPKDLFDYLKNHGWIFRRHGNKAWLGYQSKVQSGLLEHKVTTVLTADGDERITEQVRVTPKGMARLAKLFKPDIRDAA